MLGVSATTFAFTSAAQISTLTRKLLALLRQATYRLRFFQTYSWKELPNLLAHISATLVHSYLSAYPN